MEQVSAPQPRAQFQARMKVQVELGLEQRVEEVLVEVQVVVLDQMLVQLPILGTMLTREYTLK